MAVIYTISYPPGAAGRFIANILWALAVPNARKILISPNGNAHNNYEFINYKLPREELFYNLSLIPINPNYPLIVPTHKRINYQKLSAIYDYIYAIEILYSEKDKYLLSLNFFFKVIIEQLVYSLPGPTGIVDQKWAHDKWLELSLNLNIENDPTKLTDTQLKSCLDYIVDNNLWEFKFDQSPLEFDMPKNCSLIKLTVDQIFYSGNDVISIIEKEFNLTSNKDIFEQYQNYINCQKYLDLAKKLSCNED